MPNLTTLSDAGNSAQSRTLSYDGLDRLAGMNATSLGGTSSYTYDVLDNLRTLVRGGAASNYGYDTSNRLTSITAPLVPVINLTWNVQGNLIAKGGQGYNFDFGNRLRYANALESYRYDGLGRRVQSWSWQTGQNIVAMYDRAGRLVHQYNEREAGLQHDPLYLGNQLVAIIDTTLGGQQSVRYQHTDYQGTVVAQTSASRSVLNRSVYDSYGATGDHGNDDQAGYTGHVQDGLTALTYMQQRYYDPSLMRFVSVDPVGVDLGTGTNFNRYWYANDNPYRYTDPNGEATYNQFDNGITIVVQKFKNNGTQFSDTQIMQQGANLSGTTSKGQVMIVLLVPGGGKDTVQINTNPKLNDMSSDGKLRSHTNKIGGRDVEIAPNAQSLGTVGHELGHVLDAGDQYKGGVSATGRPITSDVPSSTNIMKNAVGNANTQTMNEIARGATSPQNTRKSCHTTMNDKGSATVCQ